MELPRTQQTALTQRVMDVYLKHHPDDRSAPDDERNRHTHRYNRIFEAVYEALGEAGAEREEKPEEASFRNSRFESMVAAAERGESIQPTQTRNSLCACGSGKKYKRCCMR